jgi:hypothetical protein
MTLIKDCFDDPTVNVSVSPRELKLMLMAMNRFNDELYQDSYRMSDDDLERWEDLLDHVQDQALAYSA